jgi:hypothetical protein
LSQNEYEQEPEWLQDAESQFHKINVNKQNDETVTKWIQIIEDDSFEDGVIAMDVTEKVKRDMQGEESEFKRDV